MSAAAAGGVGRPKMYRGLHDAASRGDLKFVRALASTNLLLEVTAAGNNCLHIAAAIGHMQFCRVAAERNNSLLADMNKLNETPLLAAAKNGHNSVASFLLSIHTREFPDDADTKKKLSDAVLCQDIDGSDALNHAIHRWDEEADEELVKELIAAAPDLCKNRNNRGESAMYLAVYNNHPKLALQILEIPDAAYRGPAGVTSLHAAAIRGYEDIAEMIVKKHRHLLTENDMLISNPVCQAVYHGWTEVLRMFLKHDRDLGYVLTRGDLSLLMVAAYKGDVNTARLLLEYCSDAPYRGEESKKTCLHTAVQRGSVDFVRFLLNTKQLQCLVNMGDDQENTPVHYLSSLESPDARIMKSLLTQKGIDTTVLNKQGTSPVWALATSMSGANTLIWNELRKRLLRAHPGESSSVGILDAHVKPWIHAARKNTKALAKTFSGGIVALAISIMAVSFAAIFTSPGGYSALAGIEGLPVMYRKPVYHAFLLAASLAFFSSTVVAVICILAVARTQDYEFMMYYRSVVLFLLWLAIGSASTAFSTCLFTMLYPHLDWLVILICVLVALIPAVTWLLLKWPLVRLGCQLGRSSDYGLICMP